MTKSMAEHVYEGVKEWIVSGDLPGGELVSEGYVAHRLGTSRTPVREAFLTLQAQGWMRLYPKRGALVVGIGESEARNLVEARRMVELDCVRKLVESDVSLMRLVSQLKEILSRHHRAVVEERTSSGFVAVESEFHAAIVHSAGNHLVNSFYTKLAERQRRLVSSSPACITVQVECAIGDHVGLTDLIENRDLDGLEIALNGHLRLVHGVVAR